LEGLSGLKSAIVKGEVRKAYRTKLKKILMETKMCKKRKADMDKEQMVAAQPERKRRRCRK